MWRAARERVHVRVARVLLRPTGRGGSSSKGAAYFSEGEHVGDRDALSSRPTCSQRALHDLAHKLHPDADREGERGPRSQRCSRIMLRTEAASVEQVEASA